MGGTTSTGGAPAANNISMVRPGKKAHSQGGKIGAFQQKKNLDFRYLYVVPCKTLLNA